jgi:hypothetical protein
LKTFRPAEKFFKIIKITQLQKFFGSLKDESLVLKVHSEGDQMQKKSSLFLLQSKNLQSTATQMLTDVKNLYTSPLDAQHPCAVYSMQETTPKKCAHQPHFSKFTNCGGPHIANHRECQYNIQAKAIDLLMRDGMGMAGRDAVGRQPL